jgi:hypothetical protein
VCVCVCVCVCVEGAVQRHIQTETHTDRQRSIPDPKWTDVSVYVSVCKSLCLNVSLSAYVSVCKSLCLYVSLSVRVSVCMCLCQ